jgi:hypothetical protein
MDITYYHLFPGLLRTNILSMNNMRFPISWLVGLVFGIQWDDCRAGVRLGYWVTFQVLVQD